MLFAISTRRLCRAVGRHNNASPLMFSFVSACDGRASKSGDNMTLGHCYVVSLLRMLGSAISQHQINASLLFGRCVNTVSYLVAFRACRVSKSDDSISLRHCFSASVCDWCAGSSVDRIALRQCLSYQLATVGSIIQSTA
jgi:hypothetical protein